MKIVISQHGDNPAKIDLRAKSDGAKFTPLQRVLLQAVDPIGDPQDPGRFWDALHEHWHLTLSLADVKFPLLVRQIRDLGLDVELG